MSHHQKSLTENLFVGATIVYLTLPLALPSAFWEKLIRTSVLAAPITDFMLLYYLMIIPVLLTIRNLKNLRGPAVQSLLAKYSLTKLAQKGQQTLQFISWSGLVSMPLATLAALTGWTAPGFWLGIYTVILVTGLGGLTIKWLLNYENFKKITPADSKTLNGLNLLFKNLETVTVK